MSLVLTAAGFSAAILSCVAVAISMGSFFAPVAAFLAAIIMLCLAQILQSRPAVLSAFCLAVITGSAFYAPLQALIPAAVYICTYYRLKASLAASACAVVYIIVLTRDSFATQLCIFCMISAAVGLLASLADSYRKRLIIISDDNAERQELLKAQNRILIEAQDNEIRAATASERNRIAREIHDSVGHMLSRSILQVGAMKITTKEPETARQLDILCSTLDSAMNSIRTSVHRLHETSIDLKAQFVSALEPLEARFKTDIVFSISSECPYEVKLCFINITREAVSNAIRHSDGDRVTAHLKEHPGFYQFVFSDNGSTAQSLYKGVKGIGLQNITDRVCAQNGICRFDTDNGFRIFITIPKQGEHKNRNESYCS